MSRHHSDEKKIADWRKSLIGGACACLLVFIMTLTIVIWSPKHRKNNREQDDILSEKPFLEDLYLEESESSDFNRNVIYEGSCSTSRNLNVLIHLFINILSSILLGASNYGMQCLSAPTRADVNNAHEKGEWLDIGILSSRNLRKISSKRAFLWWLLILSSLPLHLLFNSVVYSSLIASTYNVYSFDESFQQFKQADDFGPQAPTAWSQYMLDLAKAGKLDNLTNAQCIDEYAIAFQSRRSDVILIIDSKNNTDSKTSSIWHRCDLLPAGYEWMCPGSTCRRSCRALLPEVKRRLDDWRPFKHRVKYCLSQPMKETCRLNFNRSIAITILVMNAIKLTILIHVVRHPPEEPLFVIGDAIQSFLISPDKASEKAGWVSVRAVRERENWNSPCVNDGKRRRWGAAASKRRWKFSIAMYAIALVFAISILIWGILAIPGPRDIISLWNLGFGAVNEVTVIKGLEDQNKSDLTSVILLSNLPQVGFSLLYFQYNGLFTSMASAKEWSDFGYMRKPLRVCSIPRGEQRSRYFLQLPYKFSIPLLLVSILVHWLLSQSIFIVAVESHGHFWYQDVEDSMRWEVISCGYSPIAIIFVIITAASMGVAVASIASLRLPTFMPVVGSCSLAIAAACHHPENMPRDGAELKPLQWGAMVYDTERKVSRHCGFSEKPVEEPEIGVMYC